jgi:putative Mg2+ transporter-C (MgtC) family protein
MNGFDGLGEVVLRLGAATLVGAMVGLDRELHDKPAGMRTHALVSLGAAMLMVVGLRLSPAGPDPGVARVIQGIITGIGFLGGGVILRDTARRDVYGLTTAASIWVVACLGVACGAGYWAAAVVALVIALLLLVVGERVELWLRRVFHRGPKRE